MREIFNSDTVREGAIVLGGFYLMLAAPFAAVIGVGAGVDHVTGGWLTAQARQSWESKVLSTDPADYAKSRNGWSVRLAATDATLIPQGEAVKLRSGNTLILPEDSQGKGENSYISVSPYTMMNDGKPTFKVDVVNFHGESDHISTFVLPENPNGGTESVPLVVEKDSLGKQSDQIITLDVDPTSSKLIAKKYLPETS